MTGATGDLTPDDSTAAFIPAELREISDAEHQADVTTAHSRAAPAQHGDIGHPGETDASGAAPRDDGYGSGHGLSPEDPAYRMESRPRPRPAEDEPRRPREGDGDAFADHEEHF